MIDEEFRDYKLDQFFGLLKVLNKLEPIQKNRAKAISDFIIMRNLENRNRFQDDNVGRMLYQ